MIFLLFTIFSETLSPENINFLSSKDRNLCRQILSSESRNGLLNYFLHRADFLLRVVKNSEEKYAHNNNGKNFLTKFIQVQWAMNQYLTIMMIIKKYF